MKKNIILYYEPTSGYGGSSRCLLQWLKNLNLDKFQPLIVCHFNGPVIKSIKNLGLEMIRIPYLNTFNILSERYQNKRPLSYLFFFFEVVLNIIPVALFLTCLIKFKTIQLVELNSSIITVIPGILAAKITNTPCICHIHDTRQLTRKEVFFAKWITKFIVLNKKAYKVYSPILGVDKINVVYNGLDLQEWKPTINTEDIKNEFNLNHSRSVVGIVGRIVHGKGHLDFLKAAKIVLDRNPDVKFMIVGAGNRQLENSLNEFCIKSGLSKNVIFTGWKNNVIDFMSIFDVLIQASSTFPEGFGLTCIEAMAISKPVVATNIPGPSEIVIDGETGFLVTPGNSEELADRILKLINNAELIEKMGRTGRQQVEQLFDIRKNIKQIESIYLQILRKY